LVAGGMADAKIIRVVGLASTVLYDKQDPYNASNRRISIVVLNKRTEEAILRDGNVAEAEPADAAGEAAAGGTAEAAAPTSSDTKSR